MHKRIIDYLFRFAASIKPHWVAFFRVVKSTKIDRACKDTHTLEARIKKIKTMISLLPDYHAIRKSPLFDRAFYLENCPEAQYSRFPPELHYLYAHVMCDAPNAHQNPSAAFNASQYLADHPDVALSKSNPLVHYLRHGKKEGRKISVVRIQKKMSVCAPTWEAWERCATAYHAFRSAEQDALITIVVPVYRGFDETLNCLFSVVKSRIQAKLPCRLVVIDDQSPDPELSRALARLAEMGLILLWVNKKNIGFVASVNIGMTQYPESDVILLNADTEVYGNWVERLYDTVYKADDIGTATPFSNNATICSYPLFCKDYPYVYGLNFSELDAIVQGVNAGQVVDIPTGVGFCMYIRRACLDATGLFDHVTFGHGYGEENDFCQRAWRLGWRSVLCADTFVRHLGSVSFAGERPARVVKAMERLRQLHPNYESDVTAFTQKDPVRPLRERIDIGILRHLCGQRKFMLHVCTAWGGGTAQHVAEMCAALNAQGVTAIKGFPDATRTRIRLCLSQLQWTGNVQDIDLANPPETIGSQLRKIGFDHLHIHHTVGFDASFPETISNAAAAAGITYDFTVHDYYCICPRINMIDHTGVFCAVHDDRHCDACLEKLGSADVPVRSIDKWRQMYEKFLSTARVVFVPDEDVAQRLVRYYPNVDFIVRKHIESTLPVPVTVKPRRPGDMLRVAVIGKMEMHKGREILKACAAEALRKKHPIQFVAIGTSVSDNPFKSFSNVEVRGTYKLSAMTEELQKAACHLAFFPAVWPETYSYTLSQAFAAGLFPVCFDLGAPARRIQELGWGAVLPRPMMSDPGSINAFLLSCPVTPSPIGIRDLVKYQYLDIIKDYYGL